jgi:hypothetical protein
VERVASGEAPRAGLSRCGRRCRRQARATSKHLVHHLAVARHDVRLGGCGHRCRCRVGVAHGAWSCECARLLYDRTGKRGGAMVGWNGATWDFIGSVDRRLLWPVVGNLQILND